MKRFLGILSFFLIFGCSSDQKELKYSFFIAGHAYGNPIKKTETKGALKGLHPPFKDKFEFINSQKNMAMGFLLGDTVWRPRDWPDALNDIESIEVPVHFIRGNHDGNLQSFKNKFKTSYSKFEFENNLYIILDTNLDNWNITDDQLVFLKNTLRNDTDKVDNVFIMAHHLFWYSEVKIPKPIPNSLHDTKGITNFWEVVEPLLVKIKKPVYLFSGDVGAYHRKKDKGLISEFYHHKHQNLTFIATGMGGEARDNFIIADVNNDGSVEFRLIYLNGDDSNTLGKLEEFSITKKIIVNK